ncbi:MAG: branched-chain amino acid ABC transporter permease [Anaerolineae bacterium]|nr:branched-chain amino acid ABC transporter permease [Anaerolineales bacterium]MCQ3973058.1 branched-chain amino acid ABC transporter permease [Anaerolineae bacterium]
MTAWRYPAFWLSLALVLIGGLAAFITGSDAVRETIFPVLMVVALASSLNILMGYTGYVSFGHIVFYGFGAYVGFYFLSIHNWSLWPAVLVGGLAAGVLALLLGSAILRLRGAYFALATIGINEAMRAFVSNFDPFGASTGLSLNFAVYKDYGGPANALWLAFTAVFVLTLLSLVVSYFVKFSRFGLGLMAIREDEDAAMVMGVRTPKAKTIAYIISAIIPGMIGVLFFFKNGQLEPTDAFRFSLSVELIVMVMLGGQGTVLGPLVGGAVYNFLRVYLLTSPLFQNLQLAIAGLLLLLIVLFVPAGMVGWLRGHFPTLRRVLE